MAVRLHGAMCESVERANDTFRHHAKAAVVNRFAAAKFFGDRFCSLQPACSDILGH